MSRRVWNRFEKYEKRIFWSLTYKVTWDITKGPTIIQALLQIAENIPCRYAIILMGFFSKTF